MYDNSFEQFPGANKEASAGDIARADAWAAEMSSDDVPEFAGDTFGAPSENIEEIKNNEGLSDAAAIINYGLNAAAKEYGVETVAQKIKNFDATNSENPIRDLFAYLGVDSPAEIDDVKMEREAVRAKEADFYENSEVAPVSRKRSPEGALQAINDMKELISEVEGADPRYEELRNEAKAAGKGYFEYAVGSKVDRDLTDLFGALAAIPKEEEPEEPIESDESIEKEQ